MDNGDSGDFISVESDSQLCSPAASTSNSFVPAFSSFSSDNRMNAENSEDFSEKWGHSAGGDEQMSHGNNYGNHNRGRGRYNWQSGTYSNDQHSQSQSNRGSTGSVYDRFYDNNQYNGRGRRGPYQRSNFGRGNYQQRGFRGRGGGNNGGGNRRNFRSKLTHFQNSPPEISGYVSKEMIMDPWEKLVACVSVTVDQ